MNLIRALLIENLGLKLVSLLLALVVYLHVFTERPATMVVSFPLQIEDLSDSLSLSGHVPAAVQAELTGTGKQFIRLWLTEPRLKISLAGIGPGHFERAVTSDDLPLISSDRLAVSRLVSPDVLSFRLDRKIERSIPVAARLEGAPRPGMIWNGEIIVRPEVVRVRGPQRAVAALDSVRLVPVRLESGRDSVRAEVGAENLPEWCEIDPSAVLVIVPLARANH